MWSYILKRLLLMIPTLFGILLVTFVVIQFVPGGPVEQLVYQLEGREGGMEGGGGTARGPGHGVRYRHHVHRAARLRHPGLRPRRGAARVPRGRNVRAVVSSAQPHVREL